MQKLSRSLIALGGLAALAACGDDVSITPPATIPAAVVGVTVSPATLTLKVGESATLGVSVETTGGAGSGVTWTSSTPAVATVSATGGVTAVAAGNTTVRATSTVDNTKSGAAQVTVTAPVVRSVTVSPTALALTVGQSATAVATVDRDQPLAGTVTWASSATSVATVSSAGVIAGVAAGTAVITATSTADATKSAALAVTVSPVPANLTSLSVAPASVNIGPGSTQQLTPTVNTVGNPTVTYTYASGNTGVATVSNTGLVTGVANGTTVVTVTASTNTNSLSTAVTVNVNAASVSISSLTTSASGTTLPVNLAGVAGQIEATLNINSGSQQIAKVDVLIDNVIAATQNFGINGAPNAPVTLSINTAEFDANYVAKWINGPRTISAKITPASGGAPTASNTIQFTLTNADVVYFNSSVGTTANAAGLNHTGNSAVDLGSNTWWKGGFTFAAHPVSYSGQIASIAYTSAGGCGSASGTTGPTYPATFSCGSYEGTQNIASGITVTYNAGYNLTAAPTAFMTATSAGYVAGKPVYSTVTTREDNVGPTVQAVTISNPGVGGWLGSPSTFSAISTDAGVSAGVNIPTVVQWSTDGFTSVGGTATAATQLATTLVPANYSFRGFNNSAADALGNVAAANGPVNGVWGVDLTVTDAQYSNRGTSALGTRFPLDSIGTIYDGAAWNGIANKMLAVDAIDIQGSGLNNATALTQSLVRYNPSGATVCNSGTFSMNTILSDNYAQTTAPLALDCGNALGSRTGRYTWTASVKDRAGNSLIPRKGSAGSTTQLDSVYVLIDEVGPAITGLGFQTALYTGAQPASFGFSANDNYEIRDGQVALSHTTLLPTITYPYGSSAYSVGSFAASAWDATYANVLNGQNLTLGYFLGAYDQVGAGGVVANYTNVGGILTGVTASVRDWTGASASLPLVNVLSTQVQPTGAVSWTNGGNNINWAITAKTATTVTVQQIAPTSTGVYSCSRIDIFEANPTGVAGPVNVATTGNLTYRGTANFTSSPPFTDNGINRFFSYTVNVATTNTNTITAACVSGGRAIFSELF